MTWDDIIELARDQIGETEEAYFKDSKLKLYGGVIQNEISVESGCIEKTKTIAMGETDTTLTLPADCHEIKAVKFNNSYPLTQEWSKPNYSVYPTGTPSKFSLSDTTMYFNPQPTASSTNTVELTYKAKTPVYAMSVWYVNESASICALDVKTDGIEATATISGEATDFTWAYEDAPTVGEMVALIKESEGWYAVMNSEVDGDTPCVKMELAEDMQVLFLNNALPRAAGERLLKPRLFFNPLIPSEAHKVLIQGIVEHAKYRDRELSAAQIKASKYEYMKAQFAANYKWRNATVTPLAVNDVSRDIEDDFSFNPNIE